MNDVLPTYGTPALVLLALLGGHQLFFRKGHRAIQRLLIYLTATFIVYICR